MGVKTALAAMAPTAASKTLAESRGIDLAGAQALLALKCDEITELLSVLGADAIDASDTTAAGIITAQKTAMA